MRIYLLIAFLGIGISTSEAASFICTNVKSYVEKEICSDDRLSRLDVILSEAYQQAIISTNNSPNVRAKQRQWLREKRDSCKDIACIRQAYELRVTELRKLYGTSNDRLYDAATLGDAELIEKLAAEGTNINVTNKYGMTPLLYATNWNRLDAVRTLIRLGADVRYHRNGESALFIATARDTEIVRLLLEAGADPNLVTEKYQYSPLGRAVLSRGSTFQTLKKRGSYTGPFPNYVETVRLLLKAGADVNHIDSGGISPLRKAMSVNNKEIAELLLKAGANVHQRTAPEYQRDTILIETVSYYSVYNDLDAIRLLLDYGANPNDRNEGAYDEYFEWKGSGQWTGYSVLGYAAKQGWVEVAKLLLERGADPEIPRTDGKSPVEIARAKGHEDIAVLIEKYLEKKRGSTPH